ncbi:uncharacterized protein LOC132701611 [Cylas formicarius]|uniref:uncharacterized protein LOC132701611 n=1 Tax=Cylas formicarius TaxID=197179 RepID=UPI0029589AFD|nr:uncharacterized protein LOC132701611 [Cylas formicarius]
MCEEKVDAYMDYVLPLVLESGKALLEIKEDINVESKKVGVWDVVTIYDRKIENVLIRNLKNKYPTHKFIGEEESSKKKEISKLTDCPTWIIDPIDGTANFFKRMPISCISVGLTINKEQVMGIAYNPYMDELFTAIKGKGAYLNGQRIFTSGETDIKRCVFNYEISLARTSDKLYKMYMYRLKHLVKEVMGTRSYGCSVLGQCYLACGRIDAYQCDGLYPWDAAAGTLIVREAGGYVIDSSGKEFDLMDPNYLATASRELQDKFMELERKADDEMLKAAKSNLEFNP